MTLRQLREDRGLSQEQLADISRLGLRTIQRIERTNQAGNRSLAALAVALDIEESELRQFLSVSLQLDERWRNFVERINRFVFGRGQHATPSSGQYRKAEGILLLVAFAGVSMAISGHVGLLPTYLTVPAIIESTFAFLIAYGLSVASAMNSKNSSGSARR